MKDSKRPLRGLTNGPIAPTLIKFALPLLITNFLHTVSGTWNAVWVGHLLGPDDLVAVTNANVMLAILIAYTRRLRKGKALLVASRIAALGYAVPGAVLASPVAR